jgi:hypothetical protein
VSDFARDFYAAGAGDGSEETPASTSTYPAPAGPPPSSSNHNQYAPPPGAPPVDGGSSSSVGGGTAGQVPGDGRPTEVPTPGHPLLLNGRLLVYPVGFECHKCEYCFFVTGCFFLSPVGSRLVIFATLFLQTSCVRLCEKEKRATACSTHISAIRTCFIFLETSLHVLHACGLSILHFVNLNSSN